MMHVLRIVGGLVTGAGGLGLVAHEAVGVALFGQASGIDPLSGGAGWVGTGLLGAVLSWVFFVHLPAMGKQLAEKDKLAFDDREAFRKTLKDIELANEARCKSEDDRIEAMVLATDIRGEKLRSLFSDEMVRQQRTFSVELAEMRNMVIQVITGSRTAVHDIRDMATGTINAANLIREQAKRETGT